MELPISRSLIEQGDQYVFIGLRPVGLEPFTYHQDVEWPVRVITIFSLSTDGKLSYRIDMCEDIAQYKMARAHDFAGLDELKDYRSTQTLFSVYYHLAEKMIDDRIWVLATEVDRLQKDIKAGEEEE